MNTALTIDANKSKAGELAMLTHNADERYQVTLVNDAINLNATIQVRCDETIIDAAEQQGIDLPKSCQAGACISCTGKLMRGSVDHDHCFLKRAEEQEGFILTCTAYPRSDCTILTHQEDALLDFSERI